MAEDVTMPQKAALGHIKVLDLSRSLAGPWACQVFSDFGAEVIKCERPGTGDEARTWGPPFLEGENGEKTTDSAYFLTSNRGKKSITVNLAEPEGQKIIRALAADADVLVENYKVGDMERFGLSYDVMREVNPRLVYCSISGFGQSGPRSRQAAYDFAIQGMSGLMSVTGEADGRPGAGPQKVGVPVVDIITGLYGAIGALVALVQREQTEKGDFVDVALLDCAIAGITSQVMSHVLSGKVPARQGNRHPLIQPQDRIACADGDILIAVGNDAQYQKLCQALNRPDLAKDERFILNKGRVENVEVLLAAIGEEMAKYGKADLAQRFENAGVPWSPINTIPEILADPQVLHRGVVKQAPHSVTGTVDQVVSPVRLKSQRGIPLRGHAQLGEHVGEVLGQLGYDEAAIADLKERGVI